MNIPRWKIQMMKTIESSPLSTEWFNLKIEINNRMKRRKIKKNDQEKQNEDKQEI